jgi:hypothetical protein
MYFRAVEGQQFSQIGVIFIASCMLIGWGRLSVQEANKRVGCAIFHSLSAALSCVETAHLSSSVVSII